MTREVGLMRHGKCACKRTYELGAPRSSGASRRSQCEVACPPSGRIECVRALGPGLAQCSATMATQTFDIGTPLERLMNDTRVRIGAAIAGAVIIFSSVVVVNVANTPSKHKALKSVAVLPDVPLNIPIMRSWPYPETRRVESVSAPGAKAVKRNVLARR